MVTSKVSFVVELSSKRISKDVQFCADLKKVRNSCVKKWPMIFFPKKRFICKI